jgi:hypothetical protein
MGFISWVEGNWFQALQSASIAFGLLISGLGFFQGARERRVSNLLKLSESHRSLWAEASKRPELRRVLDTEVDLVGQPVSFEEELFVNELIVHLSTAWLLAQAGSLLPLRSMRADVRAFLHQSPASPPASSHNQLPRRRNGPIPPRRRHSQ